MFKMDPPTLRSTLEQLEQAQHDHDDWHEKLIGTLLCRLPVDPSELEDDVHRRCRFGQWYYGGAQPELREQPAFAAIEARTGTRPPLETVAGICAEAFGRVFGSRMTPLDCAGLEIDREEGAWASMS